MPHSAPVEIRAASTKDDNGTVTSSRIVPLLLLILSINSVGAEEITPAPPFEHLAEAWPDVKLSPADSGGCPMINGTYDLVADVVDFHDRQGQKEVERVKEAARVYRVHPRYRRPEDRYPIYEGRRYNLQVGVVSATRIEMEAPTLNGQTIERIEFLADREDFQCTGGMVVLRNISFSSAGESGAIKDNMAIRIASSTDGALLYHQSSATLHTSFLFRISLTRWDRYVRFRRIY